MYVLYGLLCDCDDTAMAHVSLLDRLTLAYRGRSLIRGWRIDMWQYPLYVLRIQDRCYTQRLQGRPSKVTQRTKVNDNGVAFLLCRTWGD